MRPCEHFCYPGVSRRGVGSSSGPRIFGSQSRVYYCMCTCANTISPTRTTSCTQYHISKVGTTTNPHQIYGQSRPSIGQSPPLAAGRVFARIRPYEATALPRVRNTDVMRAVESKSACRALVGPNPNRVTGRHSFNRILRRMRAITRRVPFQQLSTTTGSGISGVALLSVDTIASWP